MIELSDVVLTLAWLAICCLAWRIEKLEEWRRTGRDD